MDNKNIKDFDLAMTSIVCQEDDIEMKAGSLLASKAIILVFQTV